MSRDTFSHDPQDPFDSRDTSARRSVRQQRSTPPDTRGSRNPAPETPDRGDGNDAREQHPARDRYKEEVFQAFFREALDSGSALVAIDRKTRKIVGSSRYFGYEPEKREIEIGWTFLARSYWGGKYNGEMKRLMLDHAFQFVDSVVFLVGPDNLRSRRALERIGAELAGRRTRELHGHAVEHVVYRIKKPAA